MKYRIVYTVTEPIRARTAEAARQHLQSISDDLDEFCDGAITNSNVEAKLQWSSNGKVWHDL